MCKQRLFSIIFSFLLFAVLFVPRVSAENNHDLVFPVKRQGPVSFERRDVQDAVNAFCVTLSLDPRQRTTQENLKRIVSHPGITARQRSDALLLEDLLFQVENLQQRINYVSSKKDVLRKQLIEKGYDGAIFPNDFSMAAENMHGSDGAFSYRQRLFFGRDNSLSVINGVLMDETNTLSVRLKSLQNEYGLLQSIKRDRPYVPVAYVGQPIKDPGFLPPEGFVEAAPDNGFVSQQSEEKERMVSQLKAKEDAVAETILLQPIHIQDVSAEAKSFEEFKKELGSLYVQLDTLEESVGRENGKIEELSSQVVDLSLKLSEAEILLKEKAQTIVSLRGQLTDVEQRFMLGQRIIQEKDDEIQSLRDGLQLAKLDAGTQKEKLSNVIVSKNRRLAEVEAFLRIYRDDLARAREDMRAKMSYLDQARKQLTSLRLRSVGGPDIADAENRTASSYNAVESKDEKLIELSGILEIYKDKLGTGTKIIKRNREEISVLEQRLKEMEGELKRKNRELIVTRQNLHDLESQLTSMKNELKELKSDSGQNES